MALYECVPVKEMTRTLMNRQFDMKGLSGLSRGGLLEVSGDLASPMHESSRTWASRTRDSSRNR